MKGFKWNTSTSTSCVFYKTYIRSIFDYSHIVFSTSTQRVEDELQKIQNSIVRIIKYFPIKTSIAKINQALKMNIVIERAMNLFKRYTSKKMSNKSKKWQILIQEVKRYL